MTAKKTTKKSTTKPAIKTVTANKCKGLCKCEVKDIKKYLKDAGAKFSKLPNENKLLYLIVLILFIFNVSTHYSFKVLEKKAENTNQGKKIVKQWVDENPEAIIESVNKFIMKKQKEMMKDREKKAEKSIKDKKVEVQSTKYSGVLNPAGKVTIVEFFDYNCGHCKTSAKTIEKLAKENKNIRIIFKEMPILSESSRYAAKVAMAVSSIDSSKYLKFHTKLMEGNARTEGGVLQAVKASGVNVYAIKQFIKNKDAELNQAIEKNISLAREIGINGTPAFVIEDKLISGAVSYETLKAEVAKFEK